MIRPFGEAALLVEAEDARRARAIAASLTRDPPSGVIAAIAGLASVLLELDPAGPEPLAVVPALVERLASVRVPVAGGRLHTIEVTYDGPDLADVAASTGLAPDEVVDLHAGAELEVLFCGFAPGFAYLGELPERLRVERLATPRTHTPAGSVAIAGSMSGIYPADLPGGWRVIGRTDAVLFDPRMDPPARLLPGDRVRFRPIR